MKSLRKSELAALGLVNREPMHGYRLNQAVHSMGLEHWTTLSRSSIYAALRRLAKQGAVSVKREREGQMPVRNVYHITDDGRRLLLEILREALSYVGPEDRYFYLGVAFADALPTDKTVALLEQRCGRLREAVEQEKRHAIESPGSAPARGRFVLMSEAGVRHAEVEMEFCSQLVELLRTNPDYFARRRGASHE
jgi:DNA-binding PadR family transcriptional regulator